MNSYIVSFACSENSISTTQYTTVWARSKKKAVELVEMTTPQTAIVALIGVKRLPKWASKIWADHNTTALEILREKENK